MNHRTHLYAFLLFLSLALPARSQEWQAATEVSDAEIKKLGVDAFFSADAISDATFRRMQGKSYGEGCPVGRSELRYLRLLHRNMKGKVQRGEMVCHEKIAPALLRIFRSLYEKGYRIERMVLIDDYDGDDERSMSANNTSCFNFRPVRGSKRVSKHGYGLAVDLNPLYNPCVRSRNGHTDVEPAKGRPYAFRRAQRTDIPCKISANDAACRLFRNEGFTWGGNWRSLKDYQHFEK